MQLVQLSPLPASRLRSGFCVPGVTVAPRPTLEPGDLVTPAVFARAIGVPLPTVRSWIHRSQDILGRQVEPLGTLGRWPAYDWNDLAALHAAMRRRREQRQAAALPRGPSV